MLTCQTFSISSFYFLREFATFLHLKMSFLDLSKNAIIGCSPSLFMFSGIRSRLKFWFSRFSACPSSFSSTCLIITFYEAKVELRDIKQSLLQAAAIDWALWMTSTHQNTVHISDNKSLVTTMASLSLSSFPLPPTATTFVMPIRARWEDSLQLLRSSMCFSQRGKINSSSSSASSSSFFSAKVQACSLSPFSLSPHLKEYKRMRTSPEGIQLIYYFIRI